jgi:hypothetical protein
MMEENIFPADIGMCRWTTGKDNLNAITIGNVVLSTLIWLIMPYEICFFLPLGDPVKNEKLLISFLFKPGEEEIGLWSRGHAREVSTKRANIKHSYS